MCNYGKDLARSVFFCDSCGVKIPIFVLDSYEFGVMILVKNIYSCGCVVVILICDP